MATTVEDLLKSAIKLRDSLLDESERIVYQNEDVIIRLQTGQIDEGIGSDGKPLKNSNSLFSGRYTLSTQLMSEGRSLLAPKIAGELYNFLATGAFMSGWNIELSADKTQVYITNNGTGSGDKKAFFDGYKDSLIGLDKENEEVLNYDIILPKLQEFAHKTL